MSQSAQNRKRVLITAGPTHEPIDAVRYISNRSSGRMGIALAEAAAARGMAITLLLGPTERTMRAAPRESSQPRTVRFQTTSELQALLAEHWPQHDLLIMAAAVADYRPAGADEIRARKLPRSSERLSLELEPTPDLLAEAAAGARPDQVLIGFALEQPDRLLESARDKLLRKGVHGIVANPLTTMSAQTITAKLLLRDGRTIDAPPDLRKREFADWLLDQITMQM